jgi:hypothetical protein
MSSSKIEALKQKQAALNAQIRKEQTALVRKERANDTRRKIIVGAVMIANALKNPETAKWLAKQLDRNVTKDADRELLGDLLIPPPEPMTASSPSPVPPPVNSNFQQAAAETASAAQETKTFENIFNQASPLSLNL